MGIQIGCLIWWVWLIFDCCWLRVFDIAINQLRKHRTGEGQRRGVLLMLDEVWVGVVIIGDGARVRGHDIAIGFTLMLIVKCDWIWGT